MSIVGAGRWISYPEQAHELADAKNEHPWLAEVPGHCLHQTLMDLDKAYERNSREARNECQGQVRACGHRL